MKKHLAIWLRTLANRIDPSAPHVVTVRIDPATNAAQTEKLLTARAKRLRHIPTL